MATSNYVTPEGTTFEVSGNRVVFPDNDHDLGGGVAITDEVATEILAFPGAGSDEETQTEWEATGRLETTRVGSSKVVEIRQTSFGRTRTVQVTLVDIADATLEL
jgi:hypothetical protein